MDLIDKINTIQRREVIDEDKKISKRALDSEFAFIHRIGQESLPPTKMDSRVSFNINKYIENIAKNLEATSQEIEPNMNSEEVLNIDVGSAIPNWNELILYLKAYRNTNKMNDKELDDLWSIIDNRVWPLLDEILNFVNYRDANDLPYNFPEEDNIKQLYNYIQDRNLSLVKLPVIYSTGERPQKVQKAIPTIEALRAQERKLIQERQKLINQNIREIGQIAPNIAGIERQQVERQMRYEQDYNRERIDALDAEIERLQAEIEAEQLQQQQAMREGERRMGLPAGFIEPMGFGKPKRKSKKKMDDDELQITVEVGNKNEASKNLKQMKKIERNLPMAFNDSNDWNYLF